MKTPVAMTAIELRQLLTKTREHDHRMYVLFLVTAFHGLRVSEAIALRRSDFSEANGGFYLTVQRLKGSLKTTQKLLTSPDPLFNENAVVSDFIRDLRPGDYLFTNGEHKSRRGKPLTRNTVSVQMVRFCQWAGIPRHKSFVHALKHTAGVLMRQSGAKLEEIQASLGHKSLNSTAMYLRVSTDEADAARSQAFAQVAEF